MDTGCPCTSFEICQINYLKFEEFEVCVASHRFLWRQWCKRKPLTWDNVSRHHTSPAGSDWNMSHYAKAMVDVPTYLWTVWALRYHVGLTCWVVASHRSMTALLHQMVVCMWTQAVLVQGSKINCPGARYNHDLLCRSANVVWVTW